MMHQGVDIAAEPGTPIFAPADGVISFAGFDGGYGQLISLDHGFGVVTRYGHCSQMFVKIGQKVHRGEKIGNVGNTGSTTGPHLHYEVRINNIPVDPRNFILDE
jgi:murein DD-endopeptidase MepM/ murein hydrolase activator NlpD